MGKRNWLNGKTAIVTGATSGIGAGVTKYLIEKHNCKVIGIIIVTDGLDEFVESLGDKKQKFSHLVYDVSKRESWVNIKNTIEQRGIQVDVLINNAGILLPFDRYENYSIDKVEKCVAVDFYAAAYSTSVMYDHIAKSKTPSFINVSSSASLAPLPGCSVYSAAKAATKSLTECFALEHPNVYVSVVCPGFTKTNLFAGQADDMLGSKLISSFMMKREKMVKKITRGIERKKRRMVFGIDAHLMNFLYKFFPKSGPRLCSFAMRISRQKIFENIYAAPKTADENFEAVAATLSSCDNDGE